MLFEEFNDACTAIWVRGLTFDYLKRILFMGIEPNYGFSPEIAGKLFELALADCIYLRAANTSVLANTGHTEFISWGVRPSYCCGRERSECRLLDDFLDRTINKATTGWRDARLKSSSLPASYKHYFFENVHGDALEVISSAATLREAKHASEPR
jgi:hypothetical protein